jgi:hypothetical protein
MLIVLTISVAVVLGTVIYLYFSKPVIWSLSEPGDPIGQPFFIVMNAFREKGPEKAAEALLDQLERGQCEEVVLGLKDNEKYTDICERESINKLDDWKLSNRVDTSENVELFYRVKRKPTDDYTGWMRFKLEKESGGWKIKNIESIY